ncbi:MAG: DUF4810 domain-containing protein [Bacteroidales bacterium]|nr:DUF4810 domain-containing protein [Bacteroidales bacterium]
MGNNGKRTRSGLPAGLCVAAAFLVVAACSGRYAGMPRAELLAYQTQHTYGSLHTLAAELSRSIQSAVKADTLHPGMYADYGVALALMGQKEAACRMLNAEVAAFPESRAMVQRIKQRLMPDLLGDTLRPSNPKADLDRVETLAYDSLTALRPLPYVAPVIDSTDTLWLQMQTPVDSVQLPIRLTATQKRELLEQAQAQEAQRKQAVQDSIAAAKRAKVKAREQAKSDRAKAKKEQEKARKAAKKEKEKQRKQDKKR